MKIGLIGLDTSHSEIFTRLLNDHNDPYHVRGARITHAIPTFSYDLAISRDRFPTYFEVVKNKYGVILIEDVEEFMTSVDAVIIGTVDGRNHLEWFKKVVGYRKPVFIDKPIVMSSVEMEELRKLTVEHNTPVMSSSSLRFSESVVGAKEDPTIHSGYFYGPTPLQEQMPGYFWYGIHLLEMVVTIFGTAIEQLKLEVLPDCEQVHLTYTNGKHVIIRGESSWHNRFGAVLHAPEKVHTLNLWEEKKPYYAGLVEHIVEFFETREPSVTLEETAQIIQLIEKINRLK